MLFKALLVSVFLDSGGIPVEKTWAVFMDMGECNNVAGLLTTTMREDKGKTKDQTVVFRCDPVKPPKK
ncbi:hypothetical protein PS720_04373 [Pseudomonas fluorescens]|nr:hypothetical protein PS720_04373 [Pseudomonas fluorescens]